MLCPAIVTVPDRGLVPVFCKNTAVAEPAVVPLAGDTLIQLESLASADHDPPLHPLGLARPEHPGPKLSIPAVARERALEVADFEFAECVCELEQRLRFPGSFMRDAQASLRIQTVLGARAQFRVIQGGRERRRAGSRRASSCL